ncbi:MULTISPECIES: ROK family protein [unclassified Enterococcus]|uniref:ROK family protein n=1 Tax=unclassified Enterococcus TaxID=2608891 RepID=UPI003D2DD330
MTYLAFDIGGTNIKYAEIDEKGAFLTSGKEPTPKTYQDLLRLLQLKSSQKNKIKGIAISSPGIYDQKNKRITGSSALSYLINQSLIKDLEERISLPIAIENDGNCALLGEIWQGAAKKCQSAVMFVIGTAVGGAIYTRGEILKGAHLSAGELGYMLVDNDVSESSYHSLGGHVGFEGVLERGKKYGITAASGVELLEEAKKELQTEMFYQKQIDYLAIGILTIQYVIDPEIIVIGGAVSQNEQFALYLKKALEKLLKKRPNYKIKPNVVFSKYGNDANLMGAVFNWMQTYENKK